MNWRRRLCAPDHLADTGRWCRRCRRRPRRCRPSVGIAPNLLSWWPGAPQGWPGSRTAGARNTAGRSWRAPRLLAMAPGILRAGSEDELSAVGAQQNPPLDAHGLGHGEEHLVAAGRAHHRQRDTGVTGRLQDDGAGMGRPACSAASIMATPMRSLTLPGRVERLPAWHHLRSGSVGHPAQPHQRVDPVSSGDVAWAILVICPPFAFRLAAASVPSAGVVPGRLPGRGASRRRCAGPPPGKVSIRRRCCRRRTRDGRSSPAHPAAGSAARNGVRRGPRCPRR